MSALFFNDRTKPSTLRKKKVNKSDIFKVNNLPFYLKEVNLKFLGKYSNVPYLSQYSLGYVFNNDPIRKTYDIKFVSPLEKDVNKNAVIIRNEPAKNVQKVNIQRVRIYKDMFEEMYHMHWYEMLMAELNIPKEKALATSMVYLPLKVNENDINFELDFQARFYHMVTKHVDYSKAAATGEYKLSMWLKKYNGQYYTYLDRKLFEDLEKSDESTAMIMKRKEETKILMKSRIRHLSILQSLDV